MKKIAFLAIASIFVLQGSTISAQRPHREQQPKRPDITKFVSNLTDDQKAKLEAITDESHQIVDHLRAQQKTVRDSIAIFMVREGDQSSKIYPLFEREAKIQTAISREMYATKVRIDEVLTKEQRQQFRKASNEHRKKNAKKK